MSMAVGEWDGHCPYVKRRVGERVQVLDGRPNVRHAEQLPDLVCLEQRVVRRALDVDGDPVGKTGIRESIPRQDPKGKG